jgi:tetratricopeptide (TPR) repeat protein
MRQLLLFVTTATLFACNGPSSDKNGTASNVKLTESSMYVEDSVFVVFHASEGKNKEADKLFQKAVDTYRNKKNPAQSVALFKQSIIEQPQARTYYELGNALGDAGKLDEGIHAYEMADVLDYKPLNKLYYNMACTYSRMKDITNAKRYLVSAIEFGYANVKNIYNDKDLENIKSEGEWDFRELVNKALSGSTDPDKMQWAIFSKEFAQVEFPLVLDMKYASHMTDDKIISYDNERYVPEMRDNQFSRDVGSEYYRVGLVKAGDSTRTLIYGVVDEMGGNTLPVYYIVSFNNRGKLIDKLQIGGHPILKDPFKVATITANHNIEIALFDITYEKNPDDEGYEDNKIIEQKEVGKEFYAISEDGHFVKKTGLLSMR